MKTNPVIYAVLLLLAVSCGTLDPAGVYQGNKTLYTMDTTIMTPLNTLDAFCSWELQYRVLLSKNPAIKRAADTIRAQTPKWAQEAVRLRDVYAAIPTEENKTNFQKALAVLNQAAIDALTMLNSNATLTVKGK